MKAAKQTLLNLLLWQGTPSLFKYVQRHCATIFFLHRFHDAERNIIGMETTALRRALTYLVNHRYELISLTDLFQRLTGSGPELRGAVAFTMDDGYLDQATIAMPLFAEFNCPVTTFVSTGFLDRQLWFWWDQIEFIFHQTCRCSIQVRLGNVTLDYFWTTDEKRAEAQTDFTERCKLVPQEEKIAAIASLAEIAEVNIPQQAPPQYAPMSWEQLRTCEDMGMTFGPHTVSHPVLSRTTPKQASYELTESWARLCAEARRPVPVFCYPNGGWQDFSAREIGMLRKLGFLGAVVGEPGYASALSFQSYDNAPFKVQRFGLPKSLPHLVQIATGIERFKQIIRGEVRA
jgi:peptidoglycan/xylan/chitin deacetylase (PgdA/CDA1 family)